MNLRAAAPWGLSASLLAVLPAHGRGDPAVSWAATAAAFAATSLVVVPFAAALASARVSGPLLRASALGLLVSLVALWPLGVLLKGTTHHRPLGGATFAVLAFMVIVGSCAACARLLTWADVQQQLLRALARGAVLVLAALGAAATLVAVRTLARSPELGTGLLDGTRSLGLAAIAGWLARVVAIRPRFGRAGLAVWLGLVIVGWWLGRGPQVNAELRANAPVLYAPFDWLGG